MGSQTEYVGSQSSKSEAGMAELVNRYCDEGVGLSTISGHCSQLAESHGGQVEQVEGEESGRPLSPTVSQITWEIREVLHH